MSEIPLHHSTYLDVPRSARGYTRNDFLSFEWEPSIDPTQMKVLLEDLAGRWVNLGTLQQKIYVPATFFPAHATLVVVGKNRRGEQIRFIGELHRGQLYQLRSSQKGDHPMSRYIPQSFA